MIPADLHLPALSLDELKAHRTRLLRESRRCGWQARDRAPEIASDLKTLRYELERRSPCPIAKAGP